jgi:aspartyl protease family protein
MATAPDSPQAHPYGKWMVIAAWISVIGLLVIVFDGVLENQYNPNQHINYATTRAGTTITLDQNRQGHYVLSGQINRVPVTFLLDTGATSVSIPAQVAQKINLPIGQQYPVQTANGSVFVTDTLLDSLTLGPIELQNIRANINPGMQSDKILLGMNVLKDLELRQQNNQLTIKVPTL